MKFGKRILSCLKSAGISQKAASQETGIPQSTLSDLIKGKKEPGISRARILAEFLEVDLHWLITGSTFYPLPQTEGEVAEPSADAAYETPLDDTSREFLALFARLKASDRDLLLDMMRRMAGQS